MPLLIFLVACLFRPFRSLMGILLFVGLCFVAYGCSTMPGHAQQSPIVQCQVGSWAQVMPDYACDAVMSGVAKLRTDDAHSLFACEDEISRSVQASYTARANICQGIWSAMLIEAVQRRQQP
jgi:hypothetical protein